jgi:hypothetical protein
MDLTWLFEGHPGIVPRTLCLYCKNLACLMESSGSSSDSAPLDIDSHTLGTLKNRYMGLVRVDSVMMDHIWDGIP